MNLREFKALVEGLDENLELGFRDSGKYLFLFPDTPPFREANEDGTGFAWAIFELSEHADPKYGDEQD